MKKLIFTAALAVAAFTSNAQDDFLNNTNCDLRIRAVCIDETNAPFNCFATTTVSNWISIPANTTTSFASIASLCGAPLTQGYEVDYGTSTGCSGNSRLISTTSPGMGCADGSPAWHHNAYLEICPCSVDDNTPDGKFITLYLNYDPSTATSSLVAN